MQATTKPAAAYAVPAVADVTHTLNLLRDRLSLRIALQPIRPAADGTGPTADDVQVSSQATGYPAGVAYAGLLAAGKATGDPSFNAFINQQFRFFSDTLPLFDDKHGINPYHHWTRPESLDSCGAMGAAFIKARRAGVGPDLKELIDRFANFVSHKQFRLEDGTLARRRPFPDSLWADDMYMSVPILAQLGALTNDPNYYDDAARQVLQISSRLFVQSSGLYTHGWHASIGDDQPRFYWARANGWCMMALVELLDVLPADHPKREEILKQLRDHAKGIASVQSGQGLWHQMLDRNDSYLETSASAMFTFAIAHAVDHGWLDAGTYGPVAIAGWNGLTTRVDSEGRVTGTCVGTSYANDYPYYYNRTFTDDQHGYGPMLMAGAEIVTLLNNPALESSTFKGSPVTVRPKIQRRDE